MPFVRDRLAAIVSDQDGYSGDDDCDAGATIFPTCQADINTDGRVNIGDLTRMKQEFMRNDCDTSICQADINDSGKVDLNDLAIMRISFFLDNCWVP